MQFSWFDPIKLFLLIFLISLGFDLLEILFKEKDNDLLSKKQLFLQQSIIWLFASIGCTIVFFLLKILDK